MVKEILIIGLVLILLYSLGWNYRQRKQFVGLIRGWPNVTGLNQEKEKLQVQVYHTDRNIVKARQDFWKLRLLINEWNVFKGMKEIKELVEQMRSNSVLEEVIQ